MVNANNAKIVMIVKGIKSDLPPEELERRARERMPAFREISGLLQKYYSHDEATGLWAGIYVWDSKASLDAYLDSDLRKSIASAYEVTQKPQIEVYPVLDVLRS